MLINIPQYHTDAKQLAAHLRFRYQHAHRYDKYYSQTLPALDFKSFTKLTPGRGYSIVKGTQFLNAQAIHVDSMQTQAFLVEDLFADIFGKETDETTTHAQLAQELAAEAEETAQAETDVSAASALADGTTGEHGEANADSAEAGKSKRQDYYESRKKLERVASPIRADANANLVGGAPVRMAQIGDLIHHHFGGRETMQAWHEDRCSALTEAVHAELRPWRSDVRNFRTVDTWTAPFFNHEWKTGSANIPYRRNQSRTDMHRLAVAQKAFPELAEKILAPTTNPKIKLQQTAAKLAFDLRLEKSPIYREQYKKFTDVPEAGTAEVITKETRTQVRANKPLAYEDTAAGRKHIQAIVDELLTNLEYMNRRDEARLVFHWLTSAKLDSYGTALDFLNLNYAKVSLEVSSEEKEKQERRLEEFKAKRRKELDRIEELLAEVEKYQELERLERSGATPEEIAARRAEFEAKEQGRAQARAQAEAEANTNPDGTPKSKRTKLEIDDAELVAKTKEFKRQGRANATSKSASKSSGDSAAAYIASEALAQARSKQASASKANSTNSENVNLAGKAKVFFTDEAAGLTPEEENLELIRQALSAQKLAYPDYSYYTGVGERHYDETQADPDGFYDGYVFDSNLGANLLTHSEVKEQIASLGGDKPSELTVKLGEPNGATDAATGTDTVTGNEKSTAKSTAKSDNLRPAHTRNADGTPRPSHKEREKTLAPICEEQLRGPYVTNPQPIADFGRLRGGWRYVQNHTFTETLDRLGLTITNQAVTPAVSVIGSTATTDWADSFVYSRNSFYIDELTLKGDPTQFDGMMKVGYGDLMMVRASSATLGSPNSQLGKCRVYGIPEYQALCHPHLLTFRLKELYSPFWVAVVTWSSWFKEQVKERAYSSTIANIRTEVMHEFDMVLPSREVQDRLAQYFITLHEQIGLKRQLANDVQELQEQRIKRFCQAMDALSYRDNELIVFNPEGAETKTRRMRRKEATAEMANAAAQGEAAGTAQAGATGTTQGEADVTSSNNEAQAGQTEAQIAERTQAIQAKMLEALDKNPNLAEAIAEVEKPKPKVPGKRGRKPKNPQPTEANATESATGTPKTANSERIDLVALVSGEAELEDFTDGEAEAPVETKAIAKKTKAKPATKTAKKSTSKTKAAKSEDLAEDADANFEEVSFDQFADSDDVFLALADGEQDAANVVSGAFEGYQDLEEVEVSVPQYSDEQLLELYAELEDNDLDSLDAQERTQALDEFRAKLQNGHYNQVQVENANHYAQLARQRQEASDFLAEVLGTDKVNRVPAPMIATRFEVFRGNNLKVGTLLEVAPGEEVPEGLIPSYTTVGLAGYVPAGNRIHRGPAIVISTHTYFSPDAIYYIPEGQEFHCGINNLYIIPKGLRTRRSWIPASVVPTPETAERIIRKQVINQYRQQGLLPESFSRGVVGRDIAPIVDQLNQQVKQETDKYLAYRKQVVLKQAIQAAEGVDDFKALRFLYFQLKHTLPESCREERAMIGKVKPMTTARLEGLPFYFLVNEQQQILLDELNAYEEQKLSLRAQADLEQYKLFNFLDLVVEGLVAKAQPYDKSAKEKAKAAAAEPKKRGRKPKAQAAQA